MSDHTVGKIEQLTHAHASTGDGRKELGEALIDGLVKSLAEAGADSSYQVETGAAPAPTGDATPLARAAVGEFDVTFMEKMCGIEDAKDGLFIQLAMNEWLLATLFRVEAAVRAEERERVWRKIYEVAKNAPVMRTDNGQQLGKEFVLDEIREAALADGVDLTSLAKPE